MIFAWRNRRLRCGVDVSHLALALDCISSESGQHCSTCHFRFALDALRTAKSGGGDQKRAGRGVEMLFVVVGWYAVVGDQIGLVDCKSSSSLQLDVVKHGKVVGGCQLMLLARCHLDQGFSVVRAMLWNVV